VSESVRVGPYDFDHVAYDEASDVLYLSAGEPREAANSEETPEGHIVRYDRRGRVIGVTLVSAKWILDRQGSVAITLAAYP
jgi:uncharacterized protein YuzE